MSKWMIEIDPVVDIPFHEYVSSGIILTGMTLQLTIAPDGLRWARQNGIFWSFEFKYTGEFMFHPHQDSDRQKVAGMGAFKVVPATLIGNKFMDISYH
jgi:hypothetical protein